MVFEGNIPNPCPVGTYGIRGQVYRLASCPDSVRLCYANLMHGSSPEATTQLLWTQSLQESDTGDSGTECAQVDRGVFTIEDMTLCGLYAVPVGVSR